MGVEKVRGRVQATQVKGTFKLFHPRFTKCFCSLIPGSGFFVQVNGLWTLVGVVSSGTLTSSGMCNVDRFNLYTKLIDFADWIVASVDRVS